MENIMTFLAISVWLAFIVTCIFNRHLWLLNGKFANPALRAFLALATLVGVGIVLSVVGFILLSIGKFLL
ncbi:MAG: hypothetical protein AAB869_04060, partial [Patescibacteria group bacterium]